MRTLKQKWLYNIWTLTRSLSQETGSGCFPTPSCTLSITQLVIPYNLGKGTESESKDF